MLCQSSRLEHSTVYTFRQGESRHTFSNDWLWKWKQIHIPHVLCIFEKVGFIFSLQSKCYGVSIWDVRAGVIHQTPGLQDNSMLYMCWYFHFPFCCCCRCCSAWIRVVFFLSLLVRVLYAFALIVCLIWKRKRKCSQVTAFC